MEKLENWPLWVRIYARQKQEKLIIRILGVVAAVLVVVVIDFLLEGKEIAIILGKDNIAKYITILFVLFFHILMVHTANNWVIRNSSFEVKSQFLTKWYSYFIGFAIIVLTVLIRYYLLGE